MAAYIEWVRQFCRSLPHTTEKVRWEHNLLFCVAEKMYCVANLEPGNGPTKITFKCTPEIFAEMIEREGMIPAPYSARNHWVSVTEVELFRQSELKERIAASYELILAKLPKRTQVKLSGTKPPVGAPKRSRSKQKPARKRLK
jgi:predicted DNA-binding protein (MmcQ/YjbR family)